MYVRLIGGEILRLCSDYILFTRLVKALNSKSIGPRPTEHVEHLIDVIKLLRFLLLSQAGPPSVELVEKVRLFQLIRIVINQAFSL